MPDEKRVPVLIDAWANHDARSFRALVYAALQGQEGVLLSDHLKITALGTPGAQVRCAPGLFVVRNTAVGGAYESYLDKFGTQIVKDVAATDASGPRSDLVIARIKNPYPGGSGTGGWQEPTDKVNGPYWDIDVITGVPATMNNVHVQNATWTAITLARITRPASTGIVTDAHITDLRSLVDLSGERITIISNPPTTAPPVAQQQWTNTKHFSTDTTFAAATTAWTDWPAGANWDVPIPSWAVEVDVIGTFNPQFDNKIYGQARMVFGGNAMSGIVFDENPPGSAWQRVNIPIIGTYAIPSSQRGQIVNMKLQLQNTDPPNHSGNLKTRNGVYLGISLNFKRTPY